MPASHASTEWALARNAMQYDLQPYASHAFAQTAPMRLGAIAALFGLTPPPVASARVLDLGCSSGGNILPLAEQAPQGDYHGVDISRVQIAAGRARVEELGLTNVTLHCQSFTEVPDSIGTFDYIVTHGVYSWVPAPVRAHLMALIGRLLKPDGIAYVSYNVLPGWRLPQALRDTLLTIVPPGLPAGERAARARSALDFIATTADPASSYGAAIREWAERIRTFGDDYIVHEFLEDCNEPCTVADFLAAADTAGLTYLGETDIAPMILDNRDPALAAQLRGMAGDSIGGTEQLLDIVTGRTFRQSLLVHHQAGGSISRSIDSSRVRDLHFIADGSFRYSGGEDGELKTAIDSAGRTVSTTNEAVGRALGLIENAYPASISCSDLVAVAEDGDDRDAREIEDVMLRLVLAGMVTPLIAPVETGSADAARPVARPMARADAARGEESTAGLRHDKVMLDPASRVLLPLLDGTHDTDELIDGLVAAARRDVIDFVRDGNVLADSAAQRDAAAEMLPHLLAGIARAGLLLPEGR